MDFNLKLWITVVTDLRVVVTKIKCVVINFLKVQDLFSGKKSAYFLLETSVVTF